MTDKSIYSEKSIDKSLYDFIHGILACAGPLADFVMHLETKYRVILFGGSVRDYLIFNGKYPPRDIDIVVAGIQSNDELLEAIGKHLGALTWRYNRFGGVKVGTSGITLDCWRIEDTYAFRKGKIKTSVKSLLDTPMLNIDRYAYDMSTMQYIDDCNKRPFPSRIDFHRYEDELLEINLIRALIYSKKYNLKLSPSIARKMKEVLTDDKRRKKLTDLLPEYDKKETIDIKQHLSRTVIRRLL